jgi:hypothetical protein
MGQEHKAAYLAGVIDSDGHVCWRGGRYAAPNVGVTNTDMGLLRWLKANIGGSTSLQRKVCHKVCTKHHPHRRHQIFKWHITGYRAVVLLEEMRPYFVIKGKKSDKVIKMFWKHLRKMECPARRQFHIAKEAKAMVKLGWTVQDHPRQPQ